MDHKQRVINYYDATDLEYRTFWTGSNNPAVHFGYYDSEANSHHKALMRMNEILAESIGVKNSDKVLDAGCGYGGSAMWLAQKYGCTVTGITLSPLQAIKARRYVEKQKLEKSLKIIEGDYTHLNFEDGSFDVYWALESLVHAENRKDVIGEAYRVLKSDGRIVIAEYTRRSDPPLDSLEEKYMKPWLEGWAMPRLLTQEEQILELKMAGFQNIQVKDITPYVAPSLRRLEILCIAHYPIALFIAPLFNRKEKLENYYGSWRQIQALKRGLWQYSIITAQKP